MTIVYATFWGQTEFAMGHSKIEMRNYELQFIQLHLSKTIRLQDSDK